MAKKRHLKTGCTWSIERPDLGSTAVFPLHCRHLLYWLLLGSILSLSFSLSEPTRELKSAIASRSDQKVNMYIIASEIHGGRQPPYISTEIGSQRFKGFMVI